MFLPFVFYIVRISDQGCFGLYSQYNLLDRMLRLHSYQPCPQDYCTNIQYNVAKVASDWGDIIYDITREIGIS